MTPVASELPIPVESVGSLSLASQVEGGGEVVLLAQATFSLKRGGVMTLDPPAPITIDEIPPRPVGVGCPIVVQRDGLHYCASRLRIVRDRTPVFDQNFSERGLALVGCAWISGDEWLLLEGVTGARDVTASKLPGLQPQALVSYGEGPSKQIGMQLDTLLVDGALQRVRIVWRLELPRALSGLRIAVALRPTPSARSRETLEIETDSAAEPPRSTPFTVRAGAATRRVPLSSVIPGAPWGQPDRASGDDANPVPSEPACGAQSEVMVRSAPVQSPLVLTSTSLSHAFTREVAVEPTPAKEEPPSSVTQVRAPEPAPEPARPRKDPWADCSETPAPPPPKASARQQRRTIAPAKLQNELYRSFSKRSV